MVQRVGGNAGGGAQDAERTRHGLHGSAPRSSAPPDAIDRAATVHRSAPPHCGSSHGRRRTYDAPLWNADRPAIDDRLSWSIAHCKRGEREERDTGAG